MEERPSRGRMALFALVICLVILAGANGVVELLEEQGQVRTHRRDAAVHLVNDELFEVTQDGWVRTSGYADATMVPSRFKAQKEGWRAFVLGASFAMGSPYVMQGREKEQFGGIPSWLRTKLRRMYPEAGVEVINMGAGGQSAHRVARIAETVVHLAPDVLIVATCNNEGTVRPSAVSEQLHKLGGYRLLVDVLKPGIPPEKRSYYTPQSPDTEAIRRQYSSDLNHLLDVARDAEVPVMLATLPVNLLFSGNETWRASGREAPEAFSSKSPCIAEGRRLGLEQEYEAAIEQFSTCKAVAEATRGIGFAQYELGQYEAAHQTLSQAVELVPHNRCRPSLQRIIRASAERRDGVHLVDLERKAEEMSVGGIPGYDLFVDFCHMNYQGYGAMADQIIRDLGRLELGPPGHRMGANIPSTEPIAREKGLPRVPDYDASWRWRSR